MNLGQGLCICTSFRFLDSGLYPLDGFDFCFDLFWMAWHWKPAIADQHVPNNDPRNHCEMHYGSSSYSRFQSSELVISVEIARESRSVLCQIALWECFGDRFWPIILRDSVITVPYYNSPQPSPSPSLDLALANMENLRTKINFFCFISRQSYIYSTPLAVSLIPCVWNLSFNVNWRSDEIANRTRIVFPHVKLGSLRWSWSLRFDLLYLQFLRKQTFLKRKVNSAWQPKQCDASLSSIHLSSALTLISCSIASAFCHNSAFSL